MAECTDGAGVSPDRTQDRRNSALIQNLADAGCDQQTSEQFMKLEVTGEKQGQLKLLNKHRRFLLDSIHTVQKQIDCLDYLVYQIKKRKV